MAFNHLYLFSTLSSSSRAKKIVTSWTNWKSFFYLKNQYVLDHFIFILKINTIFIVKITKIFTVKITRFVSSKSQIRFPFTFYIGIFKYIFQLILLYFWNCHFVLKINRNFSIENHRFLSVTFSTENLYKIGCTVHFELAILSWKPI